MSNEPVNYLGIYGTAIAMLAMVALVALIIVELSDLREEPEQVHVHESEEDIADEPLPRYDKQEPPVYGADQNDTDGSRSIYQVDVKTDEAPLWNDRR